MNGKKLARSSFAKGIAVDLDESFSAQDGIEESWELRLLNEDGAGLVATNRRGTEQIGLLTLNYRPLAIAQLSGVAYIISGEVGANGTMTGRGEIGCFPSPKPGTSNLEMAYRPLSNYGGDSGEFSQLNGPMRSSLFKFKEDTQMDIELQPDYDGTVNIIFTDGVNPIRIINSGFTVLSGGQYSLIKRQGRETNYYNKQNFEDLLQLIARSNKILKVGFRGVHSGGRVKGGSYTYYFSYTTTDGARTEIQNVSRMVSVFKGTTAASTEGTQGDGEDSGKNVVFELSDLDQSYSFVEASFVFNHGNDERSKRAYRIEKLYPIKGNTLRFVHSGMEPVQEIDLAEVSQIFTPIETAGCISQQNGHLIAADIKEKAFDVESLRKFSKLISLGHKEAELDLIGNEQDMGRTFREGMEQESLKSGTGGWNGGYYNPRNIYERLGYFGGEAYPFGICFIFPGNWVSPPFPLVGGDNLSNNILATLDAAQDPNGSLQKTLATSEFDPVTKANSKGVYRFPNRNAAGVGEILKLGKITINGVTFKIPLWDSPEFAAVRKNTIGCFFVRGDRNKDLITQGLLINTVQIPREDMYEAGHQSGYKLWDYNSENGGYKPTNSKVIPAFNYVLESLKLCKSYDGGRRSSEGINGIYSCHFNIGFRNTFDTTHFAFLSGDAFCRPSVYSEVLHEADVKIMPLKRVQMSYVVPTGSIFPNHYSFVRPVKTQALTTTDVRSAKSTWVIGGTGVPNGDNFAAEGKFSAENPAVVVNGVEYNYNLFHCKFNEYVGIKFFSSFYQVGEPSTAGNAVQVKENGLRGLSSMGAFLVNVYRNGGQYDFNDLADLYSVMTDVNYTQISERMYWNELNANLDANRKLTVYGGDCFVAPVFRRLYYNSNAKGVASEVFQSNVGYTIGYVGESSEHPGLRHAQTEDVLEFEERPVYPYSAQGGGIGDVYGGGNNWREARVAESKGYNKGYGATKDDRNHPAMAENVPFIQRQWPAGVSVSAKHISGSFENGYRLWTGMNTQNYDASLGKIVKLVPMGEGLLAVQERGIGMMGLQERIQTGSDTAGAVFIEAPAFLPPKMRIVSGRFGAERKGMVVGTDGTAYGFSLEHMTYWKIGGDGFKSLADMRVKSRLKDKFAPFQGAKLQHGKKDIGLHWDSDKHEVWLTAYDVAAASGFSLIYHEQLRLFETFTVACPLKSIVLGTKFLSMNAMGLQSGLQWHESVNMPFGHVYGLKSNLRIRFIVNEGVDLEKLFENLQLVGNQCMPAKISYWVDGAGSVQQIAYDPRSRARSNARPGAGHIDIIIPKASIITEASASQRFTPAEEYGQSRLQERSRLKGKSLVVEIEYEADKLLRLQSVLTSYQAVYI